MHDAEIVLYVNNTENNMYFDVNDIRTDFPILSTEIYNKPLIYLDNGATAQKPRCVVEAIDDAYCRVNANVHRGVHTLSQRATDLMEESREVIKDFIKAKHSREVIFTKGTTESINLVAHSFCRQFCNEGDEIIVTEMEHHANIVPWQQQEQIAGIKLKVVPINNEGELLVDELKKLITPKTKLISIVHVSNVLGSINPIEEVIEMAHQQNIPVLIDAAQSIQHIPIDVQKLDCDFLAFSMHKVYGPTGVGILYGKERYLNEMPPYQSGGEMIGHVSFKGTTFNKLPFKFEAGTPNYVDIIASAQALNYVKKIGLNSIKAYEDELLRYCSDELLKIDNLQIYGTASKKSSVISFLVKGIHHYDMGMMLDKMGIAVRTGHHCAQPLMERLGIEGTVRVSFAFYNTKEEVDAFISGVKRIVSMF